MTPLPTGDPPDRDWSIPAPTRATLAEPLEAASGRSNVEAFAREIEEQEDDGRSAGSATHVDASDRDSVKGEETEKKEAPPPEALGSHHSNGLQDQSAYL